jgi:hypothetical protein
LQRFFQDEFFKLPNNSGNRAKFILRASSRVIRRSKTDQGGHGETIAIARGNTTCLVKADPTNPRAVNSERYLPLRPPTRASHQSNFIYAPQIAVIEAHEGRLWSGRVQFGLWRQCYLVRVLQITKGESFQWSVYTDCDRVAGRERFSKRIVEQRIEMGSFGFAARLTLLN